MPARYGQYTHSSILPRGEYNRFTKKAFRYPTRSLIVRLIEPANKFRLGGFLQLEVFARIEREVTFKLDIVFANAGTGESAQLGEISEEHCDSQMCRLRFSARPQSAGTA